MSTHKHSLILYFPSLENLGGIERVIEAQARIFSLNQFHVLIVTEHPVFKLLPSLEKYCDLVCLKPTSNAAHQWATLIREHKTEYIILHGAFYAQASNMATMLHHLSVKTILNIHFSFPSPLYLGGDERMYSSHLDVAKHCDAVAVVSKMDQLFWAALGCPAFHVQNPIKKPSPSTTCSVKNRRRNILWIGRLMEQKMPEEALHIMHEVLIRVPDAQLMMLGGTKRDIQRLSKLANTLGIESHVIFKAEQPDIDSCYSESDIHLLTSITESFCLVIAEAKARGIPTVMYDIPYLDLLDNKQGITTASYGDRTGMAEHIAKLLLDEFEYNKQSIHAMESLNTFNDDAVLNSWVNIFDTLAGHTKHADFNSSHISGKELGIILTTMLHAWSHHIDRDLWKIDYWNTFQKIVGTKSARLCRRLGENIFAWIKKIR